MRIKWLTEPSEICLCHLSSLIGHSTCPSYTELLLFSKHTMRVTSHPDLPGTGLVLALKFLHSQKFLSPGQTRTVGHPIPLSRSFSLPKMFRKLYCRTRPEKVLAGQSRGQGWAIYILGSPSLDHIVNHEDILTLPGIQSQPVTAPQTSAAMKGGRGPEWVGSRSVAVVAWDVSWLALVQVS